MSGTPKRLPDEGCHTTPLKRSAEDGVLFSSSNEKLMQPFITGCHSSLESGHDGRAAKMLRLEQHDVNKQSSLYPKNHISSSPDDSCIDHPVAGINGPEPKDLQDRKYFNSGTRETKSEVKELHSEIRTDGQGSKVETDVRRSNKDEKRLRSDWDFHSDSKSDTRSTRDGHTSLNEPKEHHKSRRCNESNKDDLESWRSVQHGSRTTDEAGKDVLTCEEREVLKAHETFGKSRLDLIGEEKTKEKERKRKDENHRDLGKADKERSEHHDYLKQGKSSHECKEHIKEDREIEKWESEKKVSQNDKEQKERVKLHAKRGLSNANEKDIPEGSVRTPVKGSSSLEPRRHKDFDGWKACESNNKVKKKDKEPDADKQEKHDGCHEKESEDRSVGVKESDKEAFGFGIQQRKRMLRPRGTPQSSNREPRLHSQPREDEG